MLDRFDDQHCIATSLELIRDTPNLNVGVVARKMSTYKIEMWRYGTIKRK
jgi:hypothetical protein